MMSRKTRSRDAEALGKKLTGNAARNASIQPFPLKKISNGAASKRSVKHLMVTSSGKSPSNRIVQETAPNNVEVNLLSPTTTQKRVKSQESTPKGQKIAKQQPMSGDDMNEPGKENEISKSARKPSMDENRNNVTRVPGRYLLKQLSSSLSPKMTTITTDTDKRVSRYGRHQKQKDNSDYVPVDLMKYVSSTPSKSKSKMESIGSNTIDKTLEQSPSSEDTTDAGSSDILPLLDEVPLSKSNDPIMFPMIQSENSNLLGMEEIKIVGMDDSCNTDDIKDSNTRVVQGLFERKISSDSAKGSSVDFDFLYTVGNLYWGAQSKKTIHWPCIVRADPETDQITRLHGDKFIEIHVSYFGDRGRRGWIKEHFLIPFEGVDVYYNKAKNMEYGKLVKQALRSEMPKRWKNACSIAEKYVTLPLEERIAKFDDEVKLELARFKITRHQTAISEDKIKTEASLALWNKRERSLSRESPAYELLSGHSPTMEYNLAKKRKMSSHHNVDTSSSRSEINGSATSEMEVFDNMDNTEYDDILKFIRYFLFDGQTSRDVENSLQMHVRSICSLKKSSHRGTERTAVRQRIHALRKSYEMLGIEHVAEVSSAVKTKIAHPAIKKEPKTLEEKFIFELDKKFLTKGVPRGFVCYICHRPNNIVKCNKCAQHLHILCVAADPEAVVKMHELVEQKNFFCAECAATTNEEKKCYICNDEVPGKEAEQKYRCVVGKCTPEYHLSCLGLFPQHRQVSANTIICPYHTCHTCVASEPQNKASMAKITLAHCVKCPTSYHPSGSCIPAGSVLLTTTQLICPKHTLEQISLNVNWCFLCGLGGDLICCETCPFACHRACLPFTPPDGKYFCEECESGRMPLYNEIVIAKLGSFRWWPALTVPPSEVPQNLLQLRQKASDICVKFFDTHDMAWLNRKRMYLYQREDSESLGPMRNGSSLDKKYRSAMAEASKIFKILQGRKIPSPFISLSNTKAAPVYTKIKTNRYIPPLKAPSANRHLDGVEDSVCRCQPADDDPCGPTSACLNRAILMECSSKTCPAKERCSNQRFTKRMYPALEVRYFADKGFGLVALENLKEGQFVVEYVGEVINSQEFHRRVTMMQAAKEANYYFLTVEPDMTIDAGPKGNVSRFINHSCEPNCETQKWTIGETRVIGLFAIKDIQAGEELTFNYNLESLGNSKRVCLCGAEKCSGYIGEKYRPPQKKEPAVRIKPGRTMKSGKKKANVRRPKKTTNVINELDAINVESLDSDVILVPTEEAVTVDLVDGNTSAVPPTVVKIKQEKKDDSF